MKIFKKKPQQSAVKKTIFRKKEDKTPLKLESNSAIGPRKLKPLQNAGKSLTLKKKAPKEVYLPSQCMFHFENGTRCDGRAAGGGTLCALHGGSRTFGVQPTPFNELVASNRITSTKFDLAYHPIRFLELSKQGFSDVEIAAEFSISVATLREWSTTIKEFSLAYEIGKTMYEAYFLRVGTRNLHNDRFNNSLYKFLTMNKLGYSDKIETKSMNTSLHGVLLVPGEMSLSEWEANNIAMDNSSNGTPVQ